MCRLFFAGLNTEFWRKCALCDCAHANIQGLTEQGRSYSVAAGTLPAGLWFTQHLAAPWLALEYMVHMTKLPANMLLVRIEVPDTLAMEEIDSLPADEKAFRQLGDEWLQHNGTPVLKVPSVLVPRQWNLLLNPENPLFPHLQGTFCRLNPRLDKLPDSSNHAAARHRSR